MMKDSDLYGQSLYDLASSENLADDILCQMQTVRQLFTENPDYVRLLTEPSIPKKQRLALLDEAFGSDMQPYLLNFLKILVENGMVRDFGGCCRRYTALYNADRGIAQAEVTSAVPLSGQQLERLRAKLEEISGKKIQLQPKVDPSVLGGLRVSLEGKLLDGTVKGRLDDLRRKVSETVM
ncbi:MAG TPA: ATP synthase F1 subunit delta [Lachnospiraceae bacterium]|jgi:F-type H+-transporting ATPase subunit delta|nr:ATP synthase F1 subunit delta [Lachnospiraceae bacterium]HAP73016.1 ATP synthase F1 subunit delta [Lachnospiraceae bacterium]HBH71033.1 ATP synthase F1 subunit delta [Lachnospiraceae bacterium]